MLIFTFGSTSFEAMLDKLTTDFSVEFSRDVARSFVISIADLTLTFMTRSNVSPLMTAKFPGVRMPALLTRTSTTPKK